MVQGLVEALAVAGFALVVPACLLCDVRYHLRACYAMSGTDLERMALPGQDPHAQVLARALVHQQQNHPGPLSPTRALGDVRVWRTHRIAHLPCPVRRVAYADTTQRACYAVSGTERPYVATRFL
eukprot:3800073-Rhodomonas_salina.2